VELLEEFMQSEAATNTRKTGPNYATNQNEKRSEKDDGLVHELLASSTKKKLWRSLRLPVNNPESCRYAG